MDKVSLSEDMDDYKNLLSKIDCTVFSALNYSLQSDLELLNNTNTLFCVNDRSEIDINVQNMQKFAKFMGVDLDIGTIEEYQKNLFAQLKKRERATF